MIARVLAWIAGPIEQEEDIVNQIRGSAPPQHRVGFDWGLNPDIDADYDILRCPEPANFWLGAVYASFDLFLFCLINGVRLAWWECVLALVVYDFTIRGLQ